jgi:hypothetical protein
MTIALISGIIATLGSALIVNTQSITTSGLALIIGYAVLCMTTGLVPSGRYGVKRYGLLAITVGALIVAPYFACGLLIGGGFGLVEIVGAVGIFSVVYTFSVTIGSASASIGRILHARFGAISARLALAIYLVSILVYCSSILAVWLVS